MRPEVFLHVNGKMAIRVLATGLSSRQGLGRARIFVQVEITPQDKSVIGSEISIGGEVSHTTGGYIGPLKPMRIFHLSSTIDHANLVLDLDPGQMHAIEEARAGGSVGFNLRLEGSVRLADENVRQHVWGDISDYTVSQSDWLALLEQLGWGRHLLLELPIPDPQRWPRDSKALVHFQKGQSEYLAGRYKSAVMDCRHALTALRSDLEVNGDTYQELERRIKNVRKDELDKPARFHLLAIALKATSDLAAHPEVDEIDRADASAILTMVAALLSQRFSGRRS